MLNYTRVLATGMNARTPVFVAASTALFAALLFVPPDVRSHERVKTSVTYDREISRILSRRCLSCHVGGSLAVPFTTYEETRPWARAIEEEVLARHMPPWRAVPGYGRFANDGALTTREHQTLLAWIEGNGPKTPEQLLIVNIDQGTTAAEEQLKPDFDRWQLGEPQMVAAIPATAAPVPGPAGLRVVRETVALGLHDARGVRSLEFRPGDRSGLRAATFSVAGTGQWLGAWTPWHPGVLLPADVVYALRSDARVEVALYYQAGGAPAAQAGQLGLTFSTAASPVCTGDVVLQASGDVAPSSVRQKFQARTTLAHDIAALALAPDLREGARTLEVRARRPDGRVDVLLLVDDVLHDWPTPYIFAAPVPLVRGTELTVTSYFDNPGGDHSPGGFELRVSAASPGQCGPSSRR